MAAITRKSLSDATSSPATFSYAQAARGSSAGISSAPLSSKAPSGANTPAKEAEQADGKWAAEGENAARGELSAEIVAKARDNESNGAATTEKSGQVAQPTAESGVSSPSVGASASSTTTKEDDASSLPNGSSESTWDNKSQTSNVGEKSNGANDSTAEGERSKEKKGKKEKMPAKALQEAPLPAVNIWKQRAEAKSKVGPSTNSTKSAGPASKIAPPKPTAEKSSEPAKADVRRKSKTDEQDVTNMTKSTTVKSKEESSRPQADTPKLRRSAAPVPPVKDQESWPTPDTVQDEDRKKAQEKTEKPEKERPAASKTHGKNEWVSLPYTPSVVFSTPLPSSNPRRGGRGGSRGGAQVGGRVPNGNGLANGEKDDGVSGLPNGENSRRGRADGGSAPEVSPVKSKRASSAGSNVGGEPQRSAEQGAQAGRMPNTENMSGSQAFSRHHTAPRQKNSRKFDSDKRHDEESAFPTESGAEKPRRKSFSHADGQSGQAKPGAERRGGQYASLSGRERGENRNRGGMRGGRNAAHSYQNGHHPNSHAYTNGHAASFSMPRSPTGYPMDQQASFFAQAQQQRSWRGNGPRSQSIPSDSMYGRQGYMPMQPYVNGMYDYQGMQPMSALPYSPYVDPYQLVPMVQLQLDYYFSVDNLCKDMFLRKHMDSQGFVFLSFIADFNRVKQLTTEIEIIRYACTQSSEIDYKVGADGKDRLRRKEKWEPWVLPISERDPSAQNAGPEAVFPPSAQAHIFDPRYASRFPGAPAGMSQESFSNAQMNGGPSPEPSNGHFTNAAASNFASMNLGEVPSFAPNAPAEAANPETDSFSDAQMKNLTVIVRKRDPANTQQPHFHTAASRTFSDGSIDSHSIAEEISKADSKDGPQTNGHGPVEADEENKPEGITRSQSPSTSGNAASRLFWIKDYDSPVESESLPADANVVLYTTLHNTALKQRDSASQGSCPYDMDVLYQFWSHFLIRNFNTSMYEEFRQLAHDDSSQRSSGVGMSNLLKYYSEALSSQSAIRERIARHYVELVTAESVDNGRPAFKQLRAAWRNGALNLKNRKTIAVFIDPGLRTSLEQ